MTDKLLTSAEVAKRLGVKEGTLASWRNMLKGPPYVRLTDNPRSKVRYIETEIDKYLAAKTVKAQA